MEWVPTPVMVALQVVVPAPQVPFPFGTQLKDALAGAALAAARDNRMIRRTFFMD
jgi:hypothetical protein